MGCMSESLETSLSAAFALGTIDEGEHAAVIAGARAAASALDELEGVPRGYASLLSTYLNFCKALGIVSLGKRQEEPAGNRLEDLRAKSRAKLRVV